MKSEHEKRKEIEWGEKGRAGQLDQEKKRAECKRGNKKENKKTNKQK